MRQKSAYATEMTVVAVHRKNCDAFHDLVSTMQKALAGWRPKLRKGLPEFSGKYFSKIVQISVERVRTYLVISQNVMKQFDTVDMASGGLALVLEPRSTWEQFETVSKKWADKLNAKRVSKPIISADECLLEVQILGGEFWITYDDFQSGIQLEPKETSFNSIVLELQKELRNDL